MALKGFKKIFKSKKASKKDTLETSTAGSNDVISEPVAQDEERKDEEMVSPDSKEEESMREDAVSKEEKDETEDPTDGAEEHQDGEVETAENANDKDDEEQSVSKEVPSTNESSAFCGMNLCFPWKGSA